MISITLLIFPFVKSPQKSLCIKSLQLCDVLNYQNVMQTGISTVYLPTVDIPPHNRSNVYQMQLGLAYKDKVY